MNKKKMRLSRQSSNDGPGWLTTFNDLVTLLMVFFVLLFTMGSVNTQALGEFKNALQSGLGILGAGSQASIEIKDSRQDLDNEEILQQADGDGAPVDEQQESHPIGDVLEAFAAEPGINVSYSNQGAHITFEDFLLFDFGKAEINPGGFTFLDKLAALIQKTPYPVRVEGHTDNVPIHTARYPSNWELSIARAVNVVKYFAEAGKINPQRLSAVGYGETRPVVPNDTVRNRTKNRRVEIVLATEG
ncbi:MAG: OmpA family protein [Deltaproteobacteria bacterium]|nr:OmpA family protein [Deltaproteobacteria bacterium]MBW2483071.1 OmpA family protein [Deltaproteobacteria bacterium]